MFGHQLISNIFPLLLLPIIVVVVAPPPKRPQSNDVNQEHPTTTPPGATNSSDDQGTYNFAYSRYLEQIVKLLESDPKFQERLRGMSEDDIKAGKIAEHVDELGPDVMEQLTKAKLAEIERLRATIAKQIDEDGGSHNVKLPEHLDVANWDKFGKEDLKKLILKTVADMDELDAKRRGDFKEYEMKKEAENAHRLAQMNEDERVRVEKELQESEKRHNEHEKVIHPGSRDQLEEVWEDVDQMSKDSFDPRTFFALHDLNGDGFWNQDELDALFQGELDKVYNETNPDDDPQERIEEMLRMREHVVEQMDKNRDRQISFEEFMQDSEAQTENVDPGWKDIGDAPVYSDDELRRYEEEYAKEQGWGDTAYSTKAPTAAPPPYEHPPQQPIQPASVHVAGQQQQQPPIGGQVQQQQQQHQVPVGGDQHPVGGQQHPAGGQVPPIAVAAPAQGQASIDRDIWHINSILNLISQMGAVVDKIIFSVLINLLNLTYVREINRRPPD